MATKLSTVLIRTDLNWCASVSHEAMKVVEKRMEQLDVSWREDHPMLAEFPTEHDIALWKMIEAYMVANLIFPKSGD